MASIKNRIARSAESRARVKAAHADRREELRPPPLPARANHRSVIAVLLGLKLPGG